MHNKIDAAAQAYMNGAALDFAEAATTFFHALVDRLEIEAPEKLTDPAQAIERGERMQLAFEFDPKTPRIVWILLDDDGTPTRVMTIPVDVSRD